MPRWFVLLWARLPGWLRGWLIWQGNSKFLVGAAALCINARGEILLLDHLHHPGCPWGLPGGWLQRGEQPEAAIAREIREETGLVPRDIELLEVGGEGRSITLFFRCRLPGEVPTLQRSEIRGYLWADPAAIPVRLRAHQRRLIERYLACATSQEER